MAFALFQLGRKDEAAALTKDYMLEHPRDQGGVGNAIQALLNADAGQTAQTERSIQAAIQKGKDFGHFHHAAYTIGAAYALMNRPPDAMRWLRSAAEDGFSCYPLYEHDHSLDKLRQNSRFQQFMADMKRESISVHSLSPSQLGVIACHSNLSQLVTVAADRISWGPSDQSLPR